MTDSDILSSTHGSARDTNRMAALNWFWKLPEPQNYFQAEYVWVDADSNLRCKTKTLKRSDHKVHLDYKQYPVWNFDGSSTGQAPGTDSEIELYPVKVVRDPFRGGDNVLVLCECRTPEGLPAKGNHRFSAQAIFERKEVKKEHPWYGFEQEYTLFQHDGKTPLGWPPGSFPPPQGPYYCSIGCEKAFGRDIAEAHYRACMYSHLNISGINAEVMPGQWEFQVGPCEGIDAGDQLMLARYILKRVAEMFGAIVSLHPKPIKGDWNGSGLHTNFSTESMRVDDGYSAIMAAMPKLEEKHAEHIKVYGKGNHERLTGSHETSSLSEFSFGIAHRGASIRVPRHVVKDQKGYLEDRRPASSACPYLVSARMAETVIC